jgi:hypothetical protein
VARQRCSATTVPSAMTARWRRRPNRHHDSESSGGGSARPRGLAMSTTARLQTLPERATEYPNRLTSSTQCAIVLRRLTGAERQVKALPQAIIHLSHRTAHSYVSRSDRVRSRNMMNERGGIDYADGWDRHQERLMPPFGQKPADQREFAVLNKVPLPLHETLTIIPGSLSTRSDRVSKRPWSP